MFSLGSKTFFGFSLFTFAAAFLYGVATSDLAGITLLGSASVASAFLGIAAVAATGAGDRLSALVGHDDPLANRAPRPSVAPLLLAVAGGTVALGAALGVVAYVSAALVAVAAGIVWFIGSWREHANYVPDTTSRVSDRFGLPLGLPVAVLVLIAIIVISMSRILLAASKNGATVIAIVLAIVILTGGIAAAVRPKIDRRLAAALGVVAVLAVGAMGIVGIALGERDFAHKVTTGEGAESHSTEVAGHAPAEGGADADAAVTTAPADPAAGGSDHD